MNASKEMAMKEHPILFSTEMVQAILEGRKTQTRRVVKPQPSKATVCFKKSMSPIHWQSRLPVDLRALFPNSNPMTILGDIHKCPYGQVGDRLWVRETFKHFANKWDGTEWKSCITYKAGNLTVYDSWDKNEPPREKWWNKSTILDHWQPSIFMPRWASRITLEITGIRVERLQDITKEDSLAEGVFDSYSALWDSINGKKHSWESNPWVWVIEFKKI